MTRSRWLLISVTAAVLGAMAGSSVTYISLERKRKTELRELSVDFDYFSAEKSMELIEALDKGDYKSAYSKVNYNLAGCVFSANELKLESGHLGKVSSEILHRSAPQRSNSVFLEEESRFKRNVAEMREPHPQ